MPRPDTDFQKCQDYCYSNRATSYANAYVIFVTSTSNKYRKLFNNMLRSSYIYYTLNLVTFILFYSYIRPFEGNHYADVALGENEFDTPGLEARQLGTGFCCLLARTYKNTPPTPPNWGGRTCLHRVTPALA